jgi:glycolate oxidase iron-sulfur subunit
MLENNKPANADVVKHIDRCLSCLSCMTTCPSGVNYMHLVDHARAHIEKSYKRPVFDRAIRWVLAHILPNPMLLRVALFGAVLARPFRRVVGMLPDGQRLVAMIDLAPGLKRRSVNVEATYKAPAITQRRGRVVLLTGCAQSVIGPSINEAAIRVLIRHGVEVVLPSHEGCCGALVHHMGREAAALSYARRNIDVWVAEIERGEVDAILTTASGCGTTMKDYGYMLREDKLYAEKAKRVSILVKDISEYLCDLPVQEPARTTGQTVAYHSACSMQHGQQIKEQPKQLLRKLGFIVRDVPEGHICCGSAGVYNILQPEIANRLRARKVANIEKIAPSIIATGNLGCMTQIGTATQIPIVHTVELIDWATGGPLPAAMGVTSITLSDINNNVTKLVT